MLEWLLWCGRFVRRQTVLVYILYILVALHRILLARVDIARVLLMNHRVQTAVVGFVIARTLVVSKDDQWAKNQSSIFVFSINSLLMLVHSLGHVLEKCTCGDTPYYILWVFASNTSIICCIF